MEVKNCKNCGRLFNYIGGAYKSLCPACIDRLEEKFQEVKKYIYEKLEKKPQVIDSLEFVFPPSDQSQNANGIKF